MVTKSTTRRDGTPGGPSIVRIKPIGMKLIAWFSPEHASAASGPSKHHRPAMQDRPCPYSAVRQAPEAGRGDAQGESTRWSTNSRHRLPVLLHVHQHPGTFGRAGADEQIKVVVRGSNKPDRRRCRGMARQHTGRSS